MMSLLSKSNDGDNVLNRLNDGNREYSMLSCITDPYERIIEEFKLISIIALSTVGNSKMFNYRSNSLLQMILKLYRYF